MYSSINWLPIIFLFFFSFGVGVGLIFAAFKVRRKWVRIGAGVAGTISIAAFIAALVAFVPYAWACSLERRWRPANPKTKAELESYLSLYTQKDIQPAQSEWGNQYQLQPGERMTRYLLLGNAPLDVVYSSSNTIAAIFTSYE